MHTTSAPHHARGFKPTGEQTTNITHTTSASMSLSNMSLGSSCTVSQVL